MALASKIATTGSDPWTRLEWASFGKPSRLFSREHDRFLLCKLRFGEDEEELRREVLKCSR